MAPPNPSPAVSPNWIFTTGTSSHYDGRLGLEYRAAPDLSLRLAAGSAIAPPYLGILTNFPSSISYTTGSTSATQSVASPNLKPETAFGYNLGADYRIGSSDLVSADFYLTNLFNQFITQGTPIGFCTPPPGTTNECLPSTTGPVTLFGTSPVNLSNARYQGIELAYRHDPPFGFGFTLQGALQSAYPYHLSRCFYYSGAQVDTTVPQCTGTANMNQNLAVLPSQNFTGGAGFPANGVSNQSIPYSQAYGELRYRFRDGIGALFGETLYGNNNSLNQKAFWAANATLEFPLANQATIQISGSNIFNANSGLFIVTGGGVPIPLANGQIGLTNGNVIGPARWTLMFVRNFGQQ